MAKTFGMCRLCGKIRRWIAIALSQSKNFYKIFDYKETRILEKYNFLITSCFFVGIRNAFRRFYGVRTS